MATVIGSYVHLPDKHRDQHALFMLRKVASLVKPIMVQRGYRVGQLAEFFPREHNLLGLNVNGGQQILLRLRPPFDDHSFLPLDDIVFTMLHELAHNVHGPHDEKFYALLREHEEDYYKLRRSGYSGEGFYSEGKRLGVGRSHNATNLSEARRRALDAAERRRVLQAGSGRKLGGAPSGTIFGLTPGERAVAAAERRARDNKACGAGNSAGDRNKIEREAEESLRNGFTTKAEEDDANERAIIKAAVELIDSADDDSNYRKSDGYIYVDDDVSSPPGSSSNSGSSSSSNSGLRLTGWSCPVCTLVNMESYLQCDACGNARPPPSVPTSTRPVPPKRPTSNSATAAAAQAREKRFQFDREQKKKDSLAQAQLARIPQPPKIMWNCSRCTLANESKWFSCQACGTMKAMT